MAPVGVDRSRVGLSDAEDVGAKVVRRGAAEALVRWAVDEVADGELSTVNDVGALVAVVEGADGEVLLLTRKPTAERIR